MRTAATRLKDFPLEERLAACGTTVVAQPSAWAGRWASYRTASGAVGERGSVAASTERATSNQLASAYGNDAPFKQVICDLGCGKGEYTVAVAKLHPEILFVGIDIDGVCVVRSADLANAEGVTNAVFIYDRDPVLSNFFAEGELSGILMNFPTPYPNKKRSELRLTHKDRLLEDRHLLVPGGFIRFRADGLPLRDFSLTQLELAGYELEWVSDDVRAQYPNEPWSGYERKLTAKGAKVCGFMATSKPGPIPEPQAVAQTAPLSLVSYLPDDLEHMEYVPYGMEGCVTNLINYRKHQRAKGLPPYVPPKI